MIDFEQPFVLGIFWAAMIVTLIVFVLWLVFSMRRWRNAYDRTQAEQAREIAISAVKISALEERAKLRDQLATQELANAHDRGAEFRFRTQGVATVAMALENWLRVTLATLEQHNIPIEPPPPWFGKHRREHDAYPVIDQAREERLQEKINEYIQSVGGRVDWEAPATKEVR